MRIAMSNIIPASKRFAPLSNESASDNPPLPQHLPNLNAQIKLVTNAAESKHMASDIGTGSLMYFVRGLETACIINPVTIRANPPNTNEQNTVRNPLIVIGV